MSYLNQIKPVLFLFYVVETLGNILLVHFYLTAFYFVHEAKLALLEELWYISYLVCFYIITVLVMFASVNVCTRNQPSILEEVLRPLVACIFYTILTLLALYDAEMDLFVLYPNETDDDKLLPEKPMHPYFYLVRSQATASLACSVVYLLHCLIFLDVLLSNEDSDSEPLSSDISDDIMEAVAADYEPVHLYVLGRNVQSWLERYQWFRDFTGREAQI